MSGAGMHSIARRLYRLGYVPIPLGTEKRPFDERVIVHERLQELGVA